MTERNVNVDYCGIVNLLRHLVKNSLITEKEAKKIAARIATEEQVDIVRTAYEYQYMLNSINNDINRLKSAARNF